MLKIQQFKQWIQKTFYDSRSDLLKDFMVQKVTVRMQQSNLIGYDPIIILELLKHILSIHTNDLTLNTGIKQFYFGQKHLEITCFCSELVEDHYQS